MKVLFNPAFNPLGGSLVTLIEFYNKARGNFLCGSQVIHNLKSSWITKSYFSGCKIFIISSIKFNPKWQFYKITQLPFTNPSFIAAKATFSYPSPIDTFTVPFFFFLAKSSIAEVGSAPALNKKIIGYMLELSYHIPSIG